MTDLRRLPCCEWPPEPREAAPLEPVLWALAGVFALLMLLRLAGVL